MHFFIRISFGIYEMKQGNDFLFYIFINYIQNNNNNSWQDI